MTTIYDQPRLALFFTRGVTLQRWVSSGLFDREIYLYNKLIESNVLTEVVLVTYHHRDAALLQQLKAAYKVSESVNITPKPWWLPSRLGDLIFSFSVPLIYWIRMQGITIHKSNQIDGAWSAYLCKTVHGGYFILRCGFLPSALSKGAKRLVWQWLQKLLSKKASHVLVANKEDARTLELKAEESSLHPTYIDTDLFFPREQPACEQQIAHFIFVGRLEQIKNLFALIAAFSNTELTLTICGDGSQRGALERWAQQCNARVTFLNPVPNSELPEILRQHDAFIMTSYYEATPKALLEALAVGLPCFVTKLTSTSEIINDGCNGFLIDGTTSEIIRQTIVEKGKKIPPSVPVNARNTILNRFSFSAFLDREANIYRKFCDRNNV